MQLPFPRLSLWTAGFILGLNVATSPMIPAKPGPLSERLLPLRGPCVFDKAELPVVDISVNEKKGLKLKTLLVIL